MAHVLVRKANGEWLEVRGTALNVHGRRNYRIVITSDFGEFAHRPIELLEVRVNGLNARDLIWVVPPEESEARGYVSFEASLDVNTSST
jgi:hypothetical protein